MLAQKLTEAMTEDLPETKSGTVSNKAIPIIKTLLERKKALAIGPGLGLNDETREVVRLLLETVPIPMIADADALTVLGTDHIPARL